MLYARLSKQTKVDEVIRIIAEYIGLSVASLNDMMRTAGYNNAWKSQRNVPQGAGGQ
jgi:hypothetical protein